MMMQPLLPSVRLPGHAHGPAYEHLRAVLSSGGIGTVSSNPWISPASLDLALRMLPGPVSTDDGIAYVVVVPRSGTDVSFAELHAEDPLVLPPSCHMVRNLRDTAGLSADAIGRMFPVARETVQRWISGTSEPSPANARRITALHALFRDASDHVTNLSAFLQTPVEGEAGETPYALLCKGRLAEVHRILASMPSARRFTTHLNEEGEHVVRVAGPIHQSNDSSSEDEYEDFD